jgi:hypothetical protein
LFAISIAGVAHASPSISITAPTGGQRWSNAVLTVKGTAKDTAGVAQVLVALNGGAWQSAASSNNWANWTAPVNHLVPGANKIQAYAVDTKGIASPTNTVSFTYVLTAAIGLQISGPGTVQVKGNGVSIASYNGQLLVVGQTYTLTAQPAAGYELAGWGQGSTSTAITIVMEPNLVFAPSFILLPHFSLIVGAAGTGAGAVEVSPLAASYVSGTEVTLTAVPSSGDTFQGWGGSVSGTEKSIKVKMTADMSVTAAFGAAGKIIPFQFVNINGSFLTGTPTSVQFLFGTVPLSVTPTVVAPNLVRVAVPPLMSGEEFAGGIAQITVIQGEGTAATNYTFAGTMTVGSLPTVNLPPGVVTASFINVAEGILTNAQANLSSAGLETDQTASTITAMLAFYEAMIGNVNTAGQGSNIRSDATPRDSTYAVNLSAETVKQMDAYFAGVLAAGQLNTTDPNLIAAYKSWDEAIQLPGGATYNPAAALKLLQAEANFQTQVTQSANALEVMLNSMMGPTTAGIAAVNIYALSSENPALAVPAAGLALSCDVLTAGLVAGLAFDSAYYTLTDNDVLSQAYWETATKMTQTFLTGKALGYIASLGGETAGEMFSALKDFQDYLNEQIALFQGVVQPQVQADVSTSLPANLPKGTYAMTMSGYSTATCCDDNGCNTSTQAIPQTSIGSIPLVSPATFESELVSALRSAASGTAGTGCSEFISYSPFINGSFTITDNLDCTSPGCTGNSAISFTLQKQ